MALLSADGGGDGGAGLSLRVECACDGTAGAWVSGAGLRKRLYLGCVRSPGRKA